MPTPARDRLNRIAFERCIPLSAQLELSGRCTHACGFCYKPAGTAESELTTEEWKTLLETLAGLGTLSVQLTGGECLLREDFREIAGHARDLHFRVTVFSNGDLLDEDLARFMGRIGIDSVQLSLHAANPELHDRLVGRPGSHEAVLRAARHLRSAGVTVALACTLTRENLAEIEPLKRLARELGAEPRFDPRLRPPARFADSSWPGPHRAVIEQVMARDDMLETFLNDPEKVPHEPGRHICAAGRTNVRIDEQGNIYPCHALALAVGNVRDGFEQIWRGSPELARLREMRFDDTRCTSCALLPWCAPCIGRHHEETGSILEPSPLICWEAALRKRLGGGRQGSNDH